MIQNEKGEAWGHGWLSCLFLGVPNNGNNRLRFVCVVWLVSILLITYHKLHFFLGIQWLELYKMDSPQHFTGRQHFDQELCHMIQRQVMPGFPVFHTKNRIIIRRKEKEYLLWPFFPQSDVAVFILQICVARRGGREKNTSTQPWHNDYA